MIFLTYLRYFCKKKIHFYVKIKLLINQAHVCDIFSDFFVNVAKNIGQN